MEIGFVAVLGLLAIVAVSAFAPKVGVAAPLILTVVGIAFGLLPGVPDVEVPPEWILAGVLPPLLYSSAITLPVVDFRRDFGTISALSVVLVVVSAVLTGLVLAALLPGVGLASAIALGAVISPTDVVAATSIGKRLGLPSRLTTILEGEGLVNDATALVLLRSAVAVGALSTDVEMDALDVVGDFGYAVAVAVAIGFVVGFATVWVRRRLADPVLDTAISFAVPFLAYLPAEHLDASGVLAVVVAGLYTGHNGARHFSAQARIAQRLNWRTVQFVLENAVFLVMGVQITSIVSEVVESRASVVLAVVIGLVLSLVLAVVRFLFVAPLLLAVRRSMRRAERGHRRFERVLEYWRSLRMLDPRQERRRERAETAFERRGNDLAQLRTEGLGWRGGLVLGWSGMRGVVTLAAAQSLPVDTPDRAQLVLIAFTVAITTLLVQGSTLPWVIRRSGVRGSDETADNRELATLLDEINEAGLTTLDDEDPDDEVVQRVRHDTLLGAQSAWERARVDDGDVEAPHSRYRALRRDVLAAEREALLDARSRRAYPSRILRRAQALLDLEETRLAQADGSADH
ncbi:CPA1 family monovalent cation:H+ antiporter [Diaminobutyricimonas aerilata]|uniref:CPA1 family monovalent cation:H+ antiporter n=1 Tax=Diaminobutyricimonas aerilata TaxID=1162967 RepID=A0A2M9CIT9_9MICO|nr:sodium:proton antiporter [Diaminobutyricimonas aerilata]PJJ71792.1 CPA1 family monovalent cation:H+ antiporter [Diaminobutyricimonas aerilata]